MGLAARASILQRVHERVGHVESEHALASVLHSALVLHFRISGKAIGHAICLPCVPSPCSPIQACGRRNKRWPVSCTTLAEEPSRAFETLPSDLILVARWHPPMGHISEQQAVGPG